MAVDRARPCVVGQHDDRPEAPPRRVRVPRNGARVGDETRGGRRDDRSRGRCERQARAELVSPCDVGRVPAEQLDRHGRRRLDGSPRGYGDQVEAGGKSARQRREAAPEQLEDAGAPGEVRGLRLHGRGSPRNGLPGFHGESGRQRDLEDGPDAREKELVRREAAAEGEGAPSDRRERFGAALRGLANRAPVGGVHGVRHDMRRAREAEHDGGAAPEEESRERGAAARSDLERAALPARIARMDAQETHGAAGSDDRAGPDLDAEKARVAPRRGPEWLDDADPKDAARPGRNGELELPPLARRQRHAPVQRVVEKDVDEPRRVRRAARS